MKVSIASEICVSIRGKSEQDEHDDMTVLAVVLESPRTSLHSWI